MKVTLYNNTSSNNTVSKKLTTVRTALTCSLKDNTDMLTPTILLSKSNISGATNFNYMYIDEFKRYYYTKSPVERKGGVLEIEGQVDVLMSHSNAIRNLYALVERQEYFYNLYMPDLKIPNVAYKRVQTIKFPTQPLTLDGTLILAVSGKG